ncbi:uncharacterized protein LOC134846203 [Symsagittifera roscoffensis]|uniref:uncharacterized protein LOC134846203 n=1 Tax=Symsagittifera roscoffensis TaxID=84072 RepID=UPI00307BFC76
MNFSSVFLTTIGYFSMLYLNANQEVTPDEDSNKLDGDLLLKVIIIIVAVSAAFLALLIIAGVALSAVHFFKKCNSNSERATEYENSAPAAYIYPAKQYNSNSERATEYENSAPAAYIYPAKQNGTCPDVNNEPDYGTEYQEPEETYQTTAIDQEEADFVHHAPMEFSSVNPMKNP